MTTTSMPTTRATVTTPTDRWACVEMEIERAPAQRLRLYVDGVERLAVDANLTGDPTKMEAPLDRVLVGLGKVFRQTPGEGFFDDVVISTKPVGCGYRR